MTIRVLVADDQPLVRMGLSGIVAAADDLVVVGEAEDGGSAVDLARDRTRTSSSWTSGCPILTASMPPSRSPRAGPRQGARPHDLRPRRVRLRRTAAGASGFLLKDVPPADLQAAIRVVASGDALLAPAVTRRLIRPGRQRTATVATPTAGSGRHSPTGSARCSGKSPRASRTPRSARGCTSRPAPPRPTSRVC